MSYQLPQASRLGLFHVTTRFMAKPRELQPDDRVRVYGMAELTHVNGGGMQIRRPFRMATVLRKDEQHGRGQSRIRYDIGGEDVVAHGRLEYVDEQDDVA